MSRGASCLLLALALVACEGADDPREATVASVLAEADEALIRSRPLLVEGKYVRMANDPYAFWRATVPLFRRDAEDPDLEIGRTAYPAGVLPLAIGDAHVENFGTLRAADGTFALEPNDFDGADRFPYHWDLRRLTVGMAVAARLSNPDDPGARATATAATERIVAATARAYADAIVGFADGAPRERVTDDGSMDPLPAIVTDLFRRSRRDEESRDELSQLTEFVDGVRRLRRGAIDPDDPENVYLDLPEVARDALPVTMEIYRRTLIAPPPAEQLVVLDAARELASGVASWPRVRIIVLTRGPTDAPDDDLIFELKELADSGSEGWIDPGVIADTVQGRVVVASRAAWARPDAEPWWGVSTLLGMPVQIKLEAEMHKTLRVSRLDEEAGTPDELVLLGERLAWLLARIHAVPLDGVDTAGPIAAAIRDDVEGFVAQEVRVAMAYAAQEDADWQHFRAALRRLGPRLGVPVDDRDQVSPDLRALYGTPVPPPEIME
ncbi:MAG: DUF2252 family protein [Myxococcales bacterium]|nr:DUF2252 family protein [Myxococcales bacterium]